MILKLKITIFTAIKPCFLEDVDIENVVVSKKISSGEKSYKYIFGYLYDYKVKPLHIMLPETSTYVKSYDGETRWMYFLMEDNDLWEKYKTIWEKSGLIVKKNLTADLSIMKNF